MNGEWSYVSGSAICLVHDAGSGYECSPVVEEDCNDLPDLCDVNAQCLYDADMRQYACRCNHGFEGDGRRCSRVGKVPFTLTSLGPGGFQLLLRKVLKNSY